MMAQDRRRAALERIEDILGDDLVRFYDPTPSDDAEMLEVIAESIEAFVSAMSKNSSLLHQALAARS